MDMSIRDQLDKDYEETLAVVRETRISTQEAEWELKKLDALHKHRMDECDKKLEAEKLKESKKDKIIEHVISAAGVILPVTVTVVGLFIGTKFENTGSFQWRTPQWVSHIKSLGKK